MRYETRSSVLRKTPTMATTMKKIVKSFIPPVEGKRSPNPTVDIVATER